MGTSTQEPAEETPAPLDAVLLVDDERPLLEMYVATLSPFFDLVTAENGPEAMQALRQRSFKVILADHVMPRDSGLDLLAWSRMEFPRTQRILVTGYLKPEMLLRSVSEAAVFRTLTKPVPVAELVRVLQEAARRYDER